MPKAMTYDIRSLKMHDACKVQRPFQVLAPSDSSVHLHSNGRRNGVHQDKSPDGAPATMPDLTLFNHFSFEREDGAPVAFATEKTRALLCYLALEANRPQRRDALAVLFWPDYGDEDARRNLRQTLHRLRQTLDEAAHGLADQVLDVGRDTMMLRTGRGLRIDVHRFTALLDEVQRHAHAALHRCSTCLRRLDDAVALYRGELLPGLVMDDSPEFEQWLLLQREALHRQVVRVLGDLVDAHLLRGETATAIRFAEHLLAFEAWNEDAHRRLMHIYLQQDRRGEAIAHFERYQRVIAEELGAPPSAEMENLLRAARQSEAAPAATESASRTAFRPLHPTLYNFPAQPTPFVGRQVDLERILDHLLDPSCRLLTILGMGGAGKTRLAMRAAQELASRPMLAAQHAPDGIYFAFLAEAASVDLAITALAGALQLTFDSQHSRAQQLCQALARARLLIVLDNVEQLLSAETAPGFVDLLTKLLSAAPGVKLLATSREPIQMRGEWRLPLDGLAYPTDANAGEAARYPAVELFVQAARHIQPAFTLDASATPAVARICRLVQGGPLALEIAASWLRLMPCNAIADEIERNLDFLEAPLRDLPERHRSMRAVFVHSWRLLTTTEQAVLARLAVFVGGFDLDAARAIAGATPLLLANLVDKSLIQRGGEGRYMLHELVRQFAAEQFTQWPSPGFAQETLQAHSVYYLKLTTLPADAEDAFLPPTQRNIIERNLDNVRSAWDFAAAYAQINLLTGAVSGLALFYRVRGLFEEGVERFSRTAVQIERTTQSSFPDVQRLLALLRLAQGRLLLEQSAYASALALLQEVQKAILPLSDPLLTAKVSAEIGVAHWRLNELDAGRCALEESLRLAEQVGANQLTAYVFHHLGNLTCTGGDRERARRYLLAAKELYTASGNLHRLAGVLNDLAIQLEAGDDATVERLLEQSIESYRAAGDEPGALIPLSNLGYGAALNGDLVRAHQLLQRGLDDALRLNHRSMAAHIAINLGHVHALAGDIEAARACYGNVLDALGLPDSERQELMIGAAFVLANSQRGELAAQLLGALAERLVQGQPGAELEDAMLHHVQQTLATMFSIDTIEESIRYGGQMTANELDALLTAELVKPTQAF